MRHIKVLHLISSHFRDILLSGGIRVFPAMSREHETMCVRKPLLSSPGSELLRRFRSRSLMELVSIDTRFTDESCVD